MRSAAWQQKGVMAVLQVGGLTAEMALSRPGDGLGNVVATGHHLDAVSILGVAFGQASDCPIVEPVESYMRGTDLVVAYEEPGKWPVRVDGVWRATASAADDAFLAAMDLIVSVRTHLLDARPDVAVQSIVPSGAVIRLPISDKTAAEPLSVTTTGAALIVPEGGAGCLLFRLPGADLSYAEMIHPADFQQDDLRGASPGNGTLRLTHRLFCTSLEKGVILRARVRGVFLRRRDDARVATRCYAEFAAAAPPLST